MLQDPTGIGDARWERTEEEGGMGQRRGIGENDWNHCGGFSGRSTRVNAIFQVIHEETGF